MKHWFKQHADTIAILGLMFAQFSWISDKFEKVNERIEQIHCELRDIEKEISTIKTVLIMKRIMPSELASGE